MFLPVLFLLYFFVCVSLFRKVHGGLSVKASKKAILNKLWERKAEQQLEAIQLGIQSEVKGKLTDLLKPGITFIVLLGITMAVFQQISGANAVFFYAPIIFEKAGMNVQDQLFQQIMIGAINCFHLLAVPVDKRTKNYAGRIFAYGVVAFLVGIAPV
jgi:SP family arabinose:H+ symporter-like MFS transporter